MASSIEELYYGNIHPNERSYRQDSHIAKLSASINEIEETLTDQLSNKEKKLFIDFCNWYSEMTGTSDLESFIAGFRLGARLIYDTFYNEDTPFV